MKDSSTRAKVYVLYSGGTIGSIGNPLHPADIGQFTELVAKQPGFSFDVTTGALTVEVYCEEDADNILKIDLVLDSFDKPIDSSSMTPMDWVSIAKRVLSNYDSFDGLVVLHGTDTMAFTASALSYMLGRGVSKPVILTGSQVPLCKTRNDSSQSSHIDRIGGNRQSY